jgi:hypothetical protein
VEEWNIDVVIAEPRMLSKHLIPSDAVNVDFVFSTRCERSDVSAYFVVGNDFACPIFATAWHSLMNNSICQLQ